MFRSAAEPIGGRDRVLNAAAHLTVIVSASLFVALCAWVTLPLPFTPVPLTLQNFGVLLVGLTLGSRRGFAALALYLAEGMMGLPVFNPTGLGGLAQLAGPTGGFLLAYPFVAGVAGLIFECGKRNLARAAIASAAAEIVLFAGGLSWLAILTHSVAQAALFGLYWFVFAEIIKVMLAAGIATGWQRVREVRE
jgi:biotin transport system substrate-specific component